MDFLKARVLTKCAKVTSMTNRRLRKQAHVMCAITEMWEAVARCDYLLACSLAQTLKDLRKADVLRRRAPTTPVCDSTCPSRCTGPEPPAKNYRVWYDSEQVHIAANAGASSFSRVNFNVEQWMSISQYFSDAAKKTNITDIYCVATGTRGGITIDRDGVTLTQGDSHIWLSAGDFVQLARETDDITAKLLEVTRKN